MNECVVLLLVLAARDADEMAPGVVPSAAEEIAPVRAALLPPRYCSEPAGVNPLPPRLRLAEVRGSSRRLMTGPAPWAPGAAVVVEARPPPPPLLTPPPLPAPPTPPLLLPNS